MKRLVFNGKTHEFRETADLAVPVVEQVPRQPQRATFRREGQPYRLRDFQPIGDGGNGYQPGKLVELGADQCRYTLVNGLMCGARGYPYCPVHAEQLRIKR